MKKLLICATLVSGLAATGLSFASAAPMMQQPASTFTGAYAGVDVGFRSVDYTVSLSSSFSSKNTQTVTQPVEGLHVGYGYQFANNFYLGAQGFAQIAQGDDRSSRVTQDGTDTSKLQFRNTYGLNGQFGYAVTDRFLPYVTAGYEWLNIQNHQQYSGVVADDSYSISQYKGGFDAGVGMKFKVADHMFVSGEFTGAWISQATKSVGTQTDKVQPNVYTGLVGLSYLF